MIVPGKDAWSATAWTARRLHRHTVCRAYAGRGEWLRRGNIVAALDSDPRPGSSATADDWDKWDRANAQLFSISNFAIVESAHATVKPFKGNVATRSRGDGVGAWRALADRFDGCTKEARRALREKLFTAVVKSSDDPTDHFANPNQSREVYYV